MLRRALRDIIPTTLWYALGLGLYGVVMIAFYPTVRDSGEEIQELIDTYPEALLRAFGFEPGSDFTDFPVYISSEYLSLIWAIVAAIFVIMAGGAVVAQEIEQGTIELWLSVPTERWRLLAAKLVALAASGLVIALVTVTVIGIGAPLVGGETSLAGLAALLVMLLAFALAVGGYAAALSALLSERSKAAGIAAALTLGSYLLSVVAGLSETVSWMRYVSIFTAFKPAQALSEGVLPAFEVAILLLIAVASGVLALIIFQRRDLAI
jgi:ABC-2 type transport system permease protein